MLQTKTGRQRKNVEGEKHWKRAEKTERGTKNTGVKEEQIVEARKEGDGEVQLWWEGREEEEGGRVTRVTRMMRQVRMDRKSGGEGLGQTDSAMTHTHTHTQLPAKCLQKFYIDYLNH